MKGHRSPRQSAISEIAQHSLFDSNAAYCSELQRVKVSCSVLQFRYFMRRSVRVCVRVCVRKEREREGARERETWRLSYSSHRRVHRVHRVLLGVSVCYFNVYAKLF